MAVCCRRTVGFWFCARSNGVFAFADRLAACIADPRSPDQITHSLADIIRLRLTMIERDANFPPFGELIAELDRARTIAAAAGLATHVAAA